MKLFYYKAACSLVVRITLNELNLPFEDEAVDLRNKKTASGSDFKSINPKGAVPALLLESGKVLTENQVILQYLADSTPNQSLLPAVGDLARYRTLEWLNFMATELHKPLGLFYNPSLAEDVKTNLLLPLIKVRFAFVNSNLAKGPYMMGEHFTLPDAYLFVMYLWARFFKIDLSDCEHLKHYIEKLKTRPSVLKSLQQEEIG